MKEIELLKKILDTKNPTVETYRDFMDILRSILPEDRQYEKKSREKWFEELLELNNEYRRRLAHALSHTTSHVSDLFSLYKDSLLVDAPYHFDSYMLYLEIGRNAKDRFYQNRRPVLKPIVDKLQALTDDELDELFLSLPPRIGKTSLLIFYITWKIGRDGEHPNLYSSYTDKITASFYNGVYEIVTDRDTYLYGDIFPNKRIVRSDAKDEILDFDRRKHYPTLTCRSIDGTLNGACDAENGIIIADDLVSGIEEALSKDRLMLKWTKVDNNLIPRGKGSTKFIWCGTRWSMLDPTGIRTELLQNDSRYKSLRYEIINLPALNDKDESNFDYANGVGFDTLYYHRRRASFERNNDMASWLAQYMGEPIEREGALFSPGDFRYYNGVLPEKEPDRVFMAVDPAFGGGDFVAGPVCVQYGDDIYIPAVVYDNRDKKVTQPLIADAVKQYGVKVLRIEATKMTESYKEEVEKLLLDMGVRLNISTKSAPTNKSKIDRICDVAPDIRQNMIFLEEGKRTKEYTQFMMNVFAFKLYSKNQHDDAPDSLAQAIDMAFRTTSRKVEIFKRFI